MRGVFDQVSRAAAAGETFSGCQPVDYGIAKDLKALADAIAGSLEEQNLAEVHKAGGSTRDATVQVNAYAQNWLVPRRPEHRRCCTEQSRHSPCRILEACVWAWLGRCAS